MKKKAQIHIAGIALSILLVLFLILSVFTPLPEEFLIGGLVGGKLSFSDTDQNNLILSYMSNFQSQIIKSGDFYIEAKKPTLKCYNDVNLLANPQIKSVISSEEYPDCFETEIIISGKSYKAKMDDVIKINDYITLTIKTNAMATGDTQGNYRYLVVKDNLYSHNIRLYMRRDAVSIDMQSKINSIKFLEDFSDEIRIKNSAGFTFDGGITVRESKLLLFTQDKFYTININIDDMSNLEIKIPTSTLGKINMNFQPFIIFSDGTVTTFQSKSKLYNILPDNGQIQIDSASTQQIKIGIWDRLFLLIKKLIG